MELKLGIRAPDFTLPDSQGNDVALSNFREKKVILYFSERVIKYAFI